MPGGGGSEDGMLSAIAMTIIAGVIDRIFDSSYLFGRCCAGATGMEYFAVLCREGKSFVGSKKTLKMMRS